MKNVAFSECQKARSMNNTVVSWYTYCESNRVLSRGQLQLPSSDPFNPFNPEDPHCIIYLYKQCRPHQTVLSEPSNQDPHRLAPW